MLTVRNAALIIIDFQGNLAQAMDNKLFLFETTSRLIRGLQILDIPMLLTEQTPGKLGPTIQEIAVLLPSIKPISKTSFSCCKTPLFVDALNALNRRQILLSGIETHICVYQTAMDLLKDGYEVQIVADAVSSRTAMNRRTGLRKMREAGASLTSTETVLFELLQTAEHEKFREIAKIVK